jgi:hypothetical protein
MTRKTEKSQQLLTGFFKRANQTSALMKWLPMQQQKKQQGKTERQLKPRRIERWNGRMWNISRIFSGGHPWQWWCMVLRFLA